MYEPKVRCPICDEVYFNCKHSGRDVSRYLNKKGKLLQKEGINLCEQLIKINTELEKIKQFSEDIEKEKKELLNRSNAELEVALEKLKREVDSSEEEDEVEE